MTKPPDRETLRRLRDDIALFAEHVVGEPLWPHQIALATDPARILAALCGRQAGKSRTLGIMGLHEGFRAPDRRILIVSAGESAARNLMAEIAQLCTAPALAGSVVDESASLIRLSNGSTIRSVPASPRQIRGQAIDLLLMDEACFIGDELWQAARFTIIARPGSRVVMASTPWGQPDRFFAATYAAGLRGEDGYSSHHWPSTVSPLVDESLLAMFRATMTDREYRTEVLAEFGDAAGAFFEPDELAAAVALGGPEGSALLAPEECFWASCGGLEADVGVDWGFARDANAAVAVAEVPRELPFARAGRRWVPWLTERYGMPYEEFIEELVAAALAGRRSGGAGLVFRSVRAETNGVGSMPTQVLRRRMGETYAAMSVEGVTTTAQSKAASFSALKMALQSEQFVLPRHPDLLRQLANLEYEQLDGGGMRIAVPEVRGHDDLVMALSFALVPSVEDAGRTPPPPARFSQGFRGAGGEVRWIDEWAIRERIEWIRRYERGREGERAGGALDGERVRDLALKSLGYPATTWDRRRAGRGR